MDPGWPARQASETFAERERPRDVTYEFGPFRLRRDGLLLANDRVVHLTPTEEAFLVVLVEAEGARVGKEEVADRVWTSSAPSDASLSRCVHTLRRKLREAAPSTPVIETCYGRGFRVSLPVRRLAPEGRPFPRAAALPEPARRPAPDSESW